MTPNDLEVLIHCHVSPTAHPRIDAPAVKEALDMLEKNGLIILHKGGDNIYSTTDKGNAFMQVLCSMPLPEQKWVDAFGKIIII